MAGWTENLGFLLNRLSFGFSVVSSALFWAIRDRFSMVPKVLRLSESDFEVFVACSSCLSIVLNHFKSILAGLRVPGSDSL